MTRSLKAKKLQLFFSKKKKKKVLLKVDLQCCDNFCLEQSDSVIHTLFFRFFSN